MQAIFAIGVVLTASACDSGDGLPGTSETTPRASVTASASPTTTSVGQSESPGTQGTSPVATTQKASTPPKSSPPASGVAVVVIRTATLQGTAIPYVPVNLRLHSPCNPADRDLPEGTPEIQRFDGVTDLSGQAKFSVPVGCYRMGMTPPAGTNPVPEGLHTLFVETAGQTVEGRFRFQDPAPEPRCAAQTIVHDLDDVADYLRKTTATVTLCDGLWAVISWDAPGDSQRIVYRATVSEWTDYVRFPHDVCWTKAKTDGAPATLQKYFSTC